MVLREFSGHFRAQGLGVGGFGVYRGIVDQLRGFRREIDYVDVQRLEVIPEGSEYPNRRVFGSQIHSE